MKEFIKNIGFINTRLREGMGLNRKTMLILKENLIREKQRIVSISGETSDQHIKKFGQFLMQVPDAVIFDIVDEYYKKCQISYTTKFSVWRKEILRLQDEGFMDDRLGWRQYGIKTRTIGSFEEINYECPMTPGLIQFGERLMDETKHYYKYLTAPPKVFSEKSKF